MISGQYSIQCQYKFKDSPLTQPKLYWFPAIFHRENYTLEDFREVCISLAIIELEDILQLEENQVIEQYDIEITMVAKL